MNRRIRNRTYGGVRGRRGQPRLLLDGVETKGQRDERSAPAQDARVGPETGWSVEPGGRDTEADSPRRC